MSKLKLKPYEIIFLFAGIGMIVSLLWIEGAGFGLWFLAKVAYFTGLAIFAIHSVREYENHKREG